MNANGKYKTKRLLSMLLAAVMVFTLLPVGSITVGAEEATTPAVGENWIANGDFSSSTPWAGEDKDLVDQHTKPNMNGEAEPWGNYSTSASNSPAGGAYVIINGNKGIDGSPCGEIRHVDDNGVKNTAGFVQVVDTNMEVGKTYLFSMWAMTTNEEMKLNCMPTAATAQNGSLAKSKSFSAANTWERFTFTIEMTQALLDNLTEKNNGEYVTLREKMTLQINTASTTEYGSIYVDDVYVSELVPATGITMTNATVSVTLGNTVKLNPSVTPANSNQPITWATSDATVATVDAFGKVTAVNSGKATITATVGELSATCTVYVVSGGGNMIADSGLDSAEAYDGVDQALPESGVQLFGKLPEGWTAGAYTTSSTTGFGNVYVAENIGEREGSCLRLQVNDTTNSKVPIGVTIPTNVRSLRGDKSNKVTASYRVTFDVYVVRYDGGTSNVSIGGMMSGPSNKSMSTSVKSANFGKWTTVSMTATYASTEYEGTTNKTVSIYLGKQNLNADVYIDNIKAEVINELVVDSSNVNVGNSLGMKFAVPAANLPEDKTGLSLQITRLNSQEEPIQIPYSDDDWKLNAAATDYIIANPYGIMSGQMDDEFEAVVLKDGIPYNTVYNESILSYSQRTYDKEGTEATLKELLADMLNYGYAAQQYFLGSATVGKDTLAASTANFTVLAENTAATDTQSYMGTNISLEESLTMKYLFNLGESTDGMTAKVTFTDIFGDKIETTVSAGEFVKYAHQDGCYIIEVKDIGSGDLYQAVTVEVSNSDGVVAKATDSVANYLSRTYNKENGKTEKNQDLIDLCLAVGEYCAAAKAHFAPEA